MLSLQGEASAKNTTMGEDKESDQAPVRKLAKNLQELRLATSEVLRRLEVADEYPETEIKAYHMALRDAETHVDGISSYLANDQEDSEEIESGIREILGKLSRAVKYVISGYNDRAATGSLPKEVTRPVLESLNDLVPFEMILAMNTMKPGELEVPAEDCRVSALNLLVLLAQAYYKLLESVIGAPCGALDLNVNNSYLWTIKSISNLLANDSDLEDFPISFEPVFPDLYPSTIRDVDWEDMVAPDAERF